MKHFDILPAILPGNWNCIDGFTILYTPIFQPEFKHICTLIHEEWHWLRLKQTETLLRWKDIDWWQNYSARMRLCIMPNSSLLGWLATTRLNLAENNHSSNQSWIGQPHESSWEAVVTHPTSCHKSISFQKCGHLDQELCGSKLFPSISVTAPENVIHITECQEGKWSQ